jgi:acetyl esterase/lipase
VQWEALKVRWMFVAAVMVALLGSCGGSVSVDNDEREPSSHSPSATSANSASSGPVSGPVSGPDSSGPTSAGPSTTTRPSDLGSQQTRHTYGPDPSQFALLYRPPNVSRGTVVVIHGGFWKAQYGIEYAVPLAADLAERGFTVWVPEYRRVGNGGGYPETFDDIDASFSLLNTLRVNTNQLVVVGHSAGGHLATWAASRDQHNRWHGEGTIAAVIAQAGVMNLRDAYRDGLGSRAVEAFLGKPSSRYQLVDPAAQKPLSIPVWCLHAKDDDIVPFAQSQDFVTQLRAAGGNANLIEVPGGHFGLIQPDSPAWRDAVLPLVVRILRKP